MPQANLLQKILRETTPRRSSFPILKRLGYAEGSVKNSRVGRLVPLDGDSETFRRNCERKFDVSSKLASRYQISKNIIGAILGSNVRLNFSQPAFNLISGNGRKVSQNAWVGTQNAHMSWFLMGYQTHYGIVDGPTLMTRIMEFGDVRPGEYGEIERLFAEETGLTGCAVLTAAATNRIHMKVEGPLRKNISSLATPINGDVSQSHLRQCLIQNSEVMATNLSQERVFPIINMLMQRGDLPWQDASCPYALFDGDPNRVLAAIAKAAPHKVELEEMIWGDTLMASIPQLSAECEDLVKRVKAKDKDSSLSGNQVDLG